MKARFIAQISFFVIAMLLVVLGCKTKHPKSPIRVDTYPHYIRANEPFRLVFEISGTNLPITKPKNGIPLPVSSDFTLSEGVTTFCYSSSHQNSQTEVYEKYVFALVPKKAGDLIIAPWKIALDSNLVVSTDTIRIHVYNERITSEDSIQKLRVVRELASNADLAIRAIGSTSKKPLPKPFGYPMQPGTFFKSADSIYTTRKGKSFEVVYSLCFLNVGWMTENELTSFKLLKFTVPTGMDKVGIRDSVFKTTGPGYTLYSRHFIVKLIADKKGNYIIPTADFWGNNKTYTAPKIKVVVK